MTTNKWKQDSETGLYGYLEYQDKRLSSENLKVLEAMLREELSRQNTDAFNVIRLIERIQDGLYLQYGYSAESCHPLRGKPATSGGYATSR